MPIPTDEKTRRQVVTISKTIATALTERYPQEDLGIVLNGQLLATARMYSFMTHALSPDARERADQELVKTMQSMVRLFDKRFLEHDEKHGRWHAS